MSKTNEIDRVTTGRVLQEDTKEALSNIMKEEYYGEANSSKN